MIRIPAYLVLTSLLTLPVAAAYAHTGETHSSTGYPDTDTAFGDYQKNLVPNRVIEVRMSDNMRFNPETLAIQRGEVIRFEIVNEGKLLHEFVLGTQQSLEAHARMMRQNPGMKHDEPYMAHVEPGQSRSITWRFSDDVAPAYGCLLPGHFEAGMKGTVELY